MIRPFTDQDVLSSEGTGDPYILGRKCVRPHTAWGGNVFHLVEEQRKVFSNLFLDDIMLGER